MTSETPEHRLKRLKIRAWRRGIKEMDLILGGWSDSYLADLPDAEVIKFDALLLENDNDLYQWVTKQTPAPEKFQDLIDRIAEDMQKLS